MRQALKPLMKFLPESYDSQDENNGPKMLFNKRDQNSYEGPAPDGVPPTADSPPTKPGAGAKIAAALKPITTRLFNPQTHASHAKARSVVPNGEHYVEYTDQRADNAYLDPAITSEIPTLWYVRDDLGISRREVQDTREIVGNGIQVTDDWAFFDAKGKVKWEGQNEIEKQPLWDERVYY